jgi:hypothetical protein
MTLLNSQPPHASASWHPSFEPIRHGIKERFGASPWAYVQYEVDSHTHLVMLGDGSPGSNGYASQSGGQVGLGEEEMSGAAEELIDVINWCDENRHVGPTGKQHGKSHTIDDKHVYKAAVDQLRDTAYDTERAHMVWMRMMHTKWGGHMPSAVVMPTQQEWSKWSLMVPDHRGDPKFYEIRPDAQIVFPTPAEMGAIADPHGIGFQAKRHWSQERRLKHLARKQLDRRRN